MSDVINEDLLYRKTLFALGISGTLPVLYLRLWVNNLPYVACDDVLTDYTPCTAPGYADYVFNPSSWVVGVSSCLATGDYPTVTFTLTGPGSPHQTIYGHVVFDHATGDVWWAQKWTTAFAIPDDGGTVKVTIYWDDMQCSP